MPVLDKPKPARRVPVEILTTPRKKDEIKFLAAQAGKSVGELLDDYTRRFHADAPQAKRGR